MNILIYSRDQNIHRMYINLVSFKETRDDCETLQALPLIQLPKKMNINCKQWNFMSPKGTTLMNVSPFFF